MEEHVHQEGIHASHTGLQFLISWGVLHLRGALPITVYVINTPGVVWYITHAIRCCGPVANIPVDFETRELSVGISRHRCDSQSVMQH